MSSKSEPGSNDDSSSLKEPVKPEIVEPIRLPSIEEIRGQDIWNNCAVRSVVSGVMGGGLGLAMGMFLGALDNPIMQSEMTGRQLFMYTAKQMGQRSWNSCKTFAVMGFIFSAAECVVEKARAKHDITNTVVAGCATGGALSAKVVVSDGTWERTWAWVWARHRYFMVRLVRDPCLISTLMGVRTLRGPGGPKAACVGCAGFAAFSVAIEKFLERHN